MVQGQMIKSMTAYGRAVVDTATGPWVVEIHSVNRKGLDITIYSPKELLYLDIPIRKWISQSLSRGQITVRIQPAAQDASLLSLEALEKQKKFWEGVAGELGLDVKKEISLPFLVEQVRLVTHGKYTDSDALKALLHKGVEQALDELEKMREQEGKLLLQDLTLRVKLIEEHLSRIVERKEIVPSKYKQRLEEKLKELFADREELELRLLQEVVFLTEKIDITEELTRLGAHIEQFRARLQSREAVGRTLDFLLQEMHRESNTIGSKSIDLQVTQEVVSIKSALEQIREQVQNIE